MQKKSDKKSTSVSVLDNLIHALGNEVARDAEAQQAGRDEHEPLQVALVLLTRDPDVHAPETRDNVHG